MSSLFPILHDLLPMIMPSQVIAVKSSELDEGTGQTGGMIRKGAIVGKCNGMCASVMIAKPHSESAIHHHGEQDTIIYAARGHGTIITNPSLAEQQHSANDDSSASASGIKKTPLAPGDFAMIPAWTEHQEINESDEEVEWIITRSGSKPVVVNLDGWGGREVH